MIVELISTGSELLLGDIINSNVAWLAKELNILGYDVVYQSTVGDNFKRMTEVLKIAQRRADIIITTGGLGPTQGDITREAVAEAVGVPIVESEEALRQIKQFFADRNRTMPEVSKRETRIPEGADVLTNPIGVAPGLAVPSDSSLFILLQGPPSEMKGTFLESVVPYLHQRYGRQGRIQSRRYAVYDIPESRLEALMMDLVKKQKNPTIAFLIKKGYIELRLTAKAKTVEAAEALLKPFDEIVIQRLGKHIGRSLNQNIEELLLEKMKNTTETVSTAESCTGGLVGKRLTDLAGSSAVFWGGVISYDNSVKEQVLGVPRAELDAYGAVSSQVAISMAEGVRRIMGTTYGISTTGIAGPGGGSQEKPVGLVYMAVAGPKGTKVYHDVFIGDRDSIRWSASEVVLHYLYEYMMAE